MRLSGLAGLAAAALLNVVEHVLEGQEVALHRDAQVADTLQRLDGAAVLGAVLETLTVHLQYLVAFLQPDLFSLTEKGKMRLNQITREGRSSAITYLGT